MITISIIVDDVIKVGDLVMLKSGGPSMEVIRKRFSMCTVRYKDGNGNICTDKFNEHTLKKLWFRRKK